MTEKALQKLYSALYTPGPMSLCDAGLTLVFTRNLTAAERRVIFNQFTVICGIECPARYYPRPRRFPGDCLANRVLDVIAKECAAFGQDAPQNGRGNAMN